MRFGSGNGSSIREIMLNFFKMIGMLKNVIISQGRYSARFNLIK